MDQHEFVATFRDHLPSVSKYLTSRVDRSDVEDLAADIFEIAWRKRAQCPPDMKLAWLYKIAGFVVANHRRKQARRGPSFAINDNDAAAPSAEDLAIGSSDVANAFAALKSGDRQVLSLLVFDDLSIKEIAMVLGVSENTTSQRLKRARQRLAALMQQQMSEN